MCERTIYTHASRHCADNKETWNLQYEPSPIARNHYVIGYDPREQSSYATSGHITRKITTTVLQGLFLTSRTLNSTTPYCRQLGSFQGKQSITFIDSHHLCETEMNMHIASRYWFAINNPNCCQMLINDLHCHVNRLELWSLKNFHRSRPFHRLRRFVIDSGFVIDIQKQSVGRRKDSASSPLLEWHWTSWKKREMGKTAAIHIKINKKKVC